MDFRPAQLSPVIRPDTLLAVLLVSLTGAVFSAPVPALEAPTNLRALSRQWRVDLLWDETSYATISIERATHPEGPFTPLRPHHRAGPAFSDFVGHPGQTLYYRVRGLRTDPESGEILHSPWSEVRSATTTPFDRETLLTEVQEAGWRYFYHYGHPVSGLAREGVPRSPELCATGATGMGLFNLALGAERGFSTRTQAAERVLTILRFLSRKARRFHGVFPHWIHGTTGEPIPFSTYDDAADLVETAFLAQGLIFVREYFQSPTDSGETEIRSLADRLWREIEWDWFAAEDGRGAFLYWHWSPNHGWRMNLPIRGFNECHIVYLLALASPTHAVSPSHYTQGWLSPDYATARTDFAIHHELGNAIGFPLFFAHYSYLGLDPRRITFNGQAYFDHFATACRVQQLYARSRRNDFLGYDELWGLTSSLDPDGYRAHAPGEADNGTLTPSAALASMPYLPGESRRFLERLYREHGAWLWGGFGFYDAFNLTRHWVAEGFLGIDVGPIAPLIENHRTGLCWITFMQAPELQSVLQTLPDRRPEPDRSSSLP